ncbi:MAG: TonB-dependent receptor [Ignavibacteriales bacterium]|nr:MAG: TonB-dependent receptor [Ignavibacteriales bacterium]
MKKVLLLCLLSVQLLLAGTTGKLSGRVKDESTGEALYGVNIILEGTGFGAATDLNGNYLINNIPPGEYTVIFSAVGYQSKKFLSVKINVDFTTRLDVNLGTEDVLLDAVVVEAKAPLVRKDLTSSQSTIDAQQIKTLPVESISQLLTLQAGVTQGVDGSIHIRGGRSSEIQYTINGIPVSNPFDNSATVQLATNAIQELSVISGTFNAEYGNAMSGIVNSITKEGGEKYTGQFSFYTGDHFSGKTSRFPNIDDLDVLSNSVTEFTLGGPVPGLEKMLGFFFSGRHDKDDGWLYGIREHKTSDSAYVNPMNPNDIRIALTGDNAIVPMNWNESYSATFKLTLKPWTAVKINYDLILSGSTGKGYDHNFKYNPEGTRTYYDDGMLNSIEIRQAISDKTFYTLRGSHNYNKSSAYLYPLLNASGNQVDFEPGMSLSGLRPDPRHQPEEKLTTPAPYMFYFGGTQNNHNYEKSQTLLAKFDIVSQIDMNHEIKTGFEVKSHTMDYQNFTVKRDSSRFLEPTILPVSTAFHDYYVKKPFEISAYIQDKMEYDNIIVNLGIRYDMFNPESRASVNIFYPTPNDPEIPPYINKDELLKDASVKHQISPRLGISFPITDKGIIHFSYGHFFQIPPFQYLYSNSDFKFSYSVGQPLYGNANLNPEKTVTYELGLQQQLTEDLAFNVTGFFKDVRDLLATQVVRVAGDKTYLKYVNKDYGGIKGFTFSLTKRRTKSDWLGVTLDYTLQIAEGNDTDADAFFLDLSSGRQSEKVVVYLPWDQTHTLNTTVSVGEAGDWNVSLIGRLGTGLPYTPQITQTQLYAKTNSGRRPSNARVDLLAEKTISLFDIRLNLFLKIFNLFDTLNERVVYFDTGRATYSLFQNSGGTKTTQELSETIPGIHSPQEYFQRPNYFFPPREVRLGVSFEFNL